MEFLHIADFEHGILRPPLRKRGIRDTVFAAELLNPNARLDILQHPDDLFLREPFSRHGPLLWGPSRHSDTQANGLVFEGEGQESQTIF